MEQQSIEHAQQDEMQYLFEDAALYSLAGTAQRLYHVEATACKTNERRRTTAGRGPECTTACD
jgi:hypothetical protein